MRPFFFIGFLGVVFLLGAIFASTQLVVADEVSDTIPSEAVGFTPSDGEVGLIYWGGGTLLQLATRLSQQGCDLSSVHTLRWYESSVDYRVRYSYYVDDGQSSGNTRFLRQYSGGIPEGNVIVACADSPAFADEEEDPEGCYDSFLDNGWSQEVEVHVLSRVGTIGDPCVLYFEDEDHAQDALGVSVSFPSAYFSHFSYIAGADGGLILQSDAFRPVVVVIQHYRDHDGYNPVFSEVYEACSAQQEWYVRHLRIHDQYPTVPWWEVWENTPAGQSFSRLLGWRVRDGEWHLPATSIFQNLNAVRPSSLATEVCMMYFIDEMYGESYFSPWLPSSVVAWVERYVAVLPKEAG